MVPASGHEKMVDVVCNGAPERKSKATVKA